MHAQFITGRSEAVLLLWFIVIVSFRPLSVGFLLIAHFIQESFVVICCERAVPLAFHLCNFYFSAVLVVRVPFPFGVCA